MVIILFKLWQEEETLITAHRKEIEDTMEIVHEVMAHMSCDCFNIISCFFLQEMKLLAKVDRPGSMIDNYVTQLSFVLSRKAAGLVSLQARLARFQHRLKEQEILSRKRVPRQERQWKLVCLPVSFCQRYTQVFLPLVFYELGNLFLFLGVGFNMSMLHLGFCFFCVLVNICTHKQQFVVYL